MHRNPTPPNPASRNLTAREVVALAGAAAAIASLGVIAGTATDDTPARAPYVVAGYMGGV